MMGDVCKVGTEGGWREQQRGEERCQPEVAWNINVRPFLPFPTQPFSSFDCPHLPLNLPLLLLLHILLPFSICPPSLASLHLPRVELVVILLSETREGCGTHGDAGLSVTMVSLANRNGAKTRRCVCACVCMGVYGCGHERALLSASG